MPAIFNDEAIAPALERIGIPTPDARDYTNDGCWEVIIPGRTDFRFQRLSMMLCLEWALNRGRTRIDGRQVGADTGDPAAFESFEDVWAAFATQVDGIVIVVNAGQTRRTMLQRTVEELQRSGTPVLGVVINRMTARTGGSYYYDYYRRYYASDDGESDENGPDEPRQTVFGRLRILGRLVARYRDNHRTDSEEVAAATEPRSRPKRIRRPDFPDPFERDPE